MPVNIDQYLEKILEQNGSDMHLKVGEPPIFRLKGELVKTEFPTVEDADLQHVVDTLLTPQKKELMDRNRGIDFSYELKGKARFRVNVFYQKGHLGAVYRLIPMEIPTMESLNLPKTLKEIVMRKQGLILITGPTGSGKSTTLSALVNYINETVSRHIITIEDPIEFVHENKKGLVNQREIGWDAASFAEALRQALRQDPDVVLVGEMRDPETINIAVTAAETGHLVFSTLHTNDAKQSIDRIIDTFPPEQQHQIRMQLALVLLAVVSQRLVVKKDGQGRVAAMEIMINSPMIKKLIEEGKSGAITKAIEDSKDYYGMQSFNQDLFRLWKDGIITQEEALAISMNPSDLKLQFQTQSFGMPK